MNRPRAVLLLVLLLGVGACAVGSPPEASTHASAELADLQDPQQLRDMFNADPDLPRLILLLSPT